MQDLINYINQHDGCKVVCVVSGHLEVTSLATINGKAVTVSEQIKANWQSVRDWLGY